MCSVVFRIKFVADRYGLLIDYVIIQEMATLEEFYILPELFKDY